MVLQTCSLGKCLITLLLRLPSQPASQKAAATPPRGHGSACHHMQDHHAAAEPYASSTLGFCSGVDWLVASQQLNQPNDLTVPAAPLCSRPAGCAAAATCSTSLRSGWRCPLLSEYKTERGCADPNGRPLALAPHHALPCPAAPRPPPPPPAGSRRRAGPAPPRPLLVVLHLSRAAGPRPRRLPSSPPRRAHRHHRRCVRSRPARWRPALISFHFWLIDDGSPLVLVSRLFLLRASCTSVA